MRLTCSPIISAKYNDLSEVPCDIFRSQPTFCQEIQMSDLSHKALQQLFTRQMRQDLIIPDMCRESTPEVVRYIRPAPGMSMILHSHLDAQNALPVIKSEIQYFSSRNLPFSWKVYDYDTPPSLLEILTREGFTPDPPDALMIFDTAEVEQNRFPSTEHILCRIDEDRLVDVAQVLESVWGGNFDWIFQRLGAHLRIPGYISIFVAYIENQPGCAGWTYYPPGSEFASLWGGSTIPALRSRGLYSAVLEARIQEAVSRGIRYLVTDASPMSKPVLEHFGFFQLATIYNCDFTGKK